MFFSAEVHMCTQDRVVINDTGARFLKAVIGSQDPSVLYQFAEFLPTILHDLGMQYTSLPVHTKTFVAMQEECKRRLSHVAEEF